MIGLGLCMCATKRKDAMPEDNRLAEERHQWVIDMDAEVGVHKALVVFVPLVYIL